MYSGHYHRADFTLKRTMWCLNECEYENNQTLIEFFECAANTQFVCGMNEKQLNCRFYTEVILKKVPVLQCLDIPN